MANIPLQKAPDGLLEALDVKNFGRTPTELGAAVQLTYDATQHYRQNLLRQTAESATVTAGGTGATLNVPLGSLWRIRLVSGSGICGAASEPMSGLLNMIIPLVPFTTSATGVTSATHRLAMIDTIQRAGIVFRMQCSYTPPMDLIVPPLTQFTFTLGATTATGITLLVNVLYEELGTIPT